MIYKIICLLSFQISTVTGELRYVDAMRLLYSLEDASERLGTLEFLALWIISIALNLEVLCCLNFILHQNIFFFVVAISYTAPFLPSKCPFVPAVANSSFLRIGVKFLVN